MAKTFHNKMPAHTSKAQEAEIDQACFSKNPFLNDLLPGKFKK